MPVTGLDHYLIRASDLERARDFYVKVLGFEVMPRPDFPFPGYWLGVNGKIQVHMGQGGVANSDLYYLGSPKNAANDNSGVVDHVAFVATDPESFVKRFSEIGIPCRARSFPDSGLYQLFIKDPDGITVELNFLGVKGKPEWSGEDYSQMPRVGATRPGNSNRAASAALAAPNRATSAKVLSPAHP